jgi:hypothetical protein
VSGSWYQISQKKLIVKTPVVLPIFKPDVNECCAKCYMKNRRLWEKHSLMNAKTTHRNPPQVVKRKEGFEHIPFAPIAIPPVTKISNDRKNIDASLVEMNAIKMSLNQHILPISAQFSVQDNSIAQKFASELDKYSHLLQQLLIEANKLLSGPPERLVTHEYTFYDSLSQQAQHQLNQLSSSCAVFSSRPVFRPFLSLIFAHNPKNKTDILSKQFPASPSHDSQEVSCSPSLQLSSPFTTNTDQASNSVPQKTAHAVGELPHFPSLLANNPDSENLLPPLHIDPLPSRDCSSSLPSSSSLQLMELALLATSLTSF